MPLDWGTRIVFLGHLIFALLAGRKLASLFLDTEIDRVASAIIFASPIFPALTAGHVEKILSWGWVLLALCILFNEKLTNTRKGMWSGLCLGIIPLTGANYYALYAGILLLPLVISYKDRKLLSFFILGSLIGLLHLPSVWQMIGHARTYAKIYVGAYSVSIPGVIWSLASGISTNISWETWTPVGIPVLLLAVWVAMRKVGSVFPYGIKSLSFQNIAVLISFVLLTLLATGIAYRGHDLLDPFRVPSRALAFIALGVVVFVLINAKESINYKFIKQNTMSLIFFASAVQIAASAWQIRPEGSVHSPYEPTIQKLADKLKADNAKSIWFSTKDLSYMYIHVGLTRNNIALPDVYYGDMGQTIAIKGNYCGYSFDHIIAFAPIEGQKLELNADVEWSNAKGEIPLGRLLLIEQMKVDDESLNVYRVICD